MPYAGVNPRSKSLRVFLEKHQPPLLLRTTRLNRRLDGTICNIPLYAINQLDTLARLGLNRVAEARDCSRRRD